MNIYQISEQCTQAFERFPFYLDCDVEGVEIRGVNQKEIDRGSQSLARGQEFDIKQGTQLSPTTEGKSYAEERRVRRSGKAWENFHICQILELRYP